MELGLFKLEVGLFSPSRFPKKWKFFNNVTLEIGPLKLWNTINAILGGVNILNRVATLKLNSRRLYCNLAVWSLLKSRITVWQKCKCIRRLSWTFQLTQKIVKFWIFKENDLPFEVRPRFFLFAMDVYRTNLQKHKNHKRQRNINAASLQIRICQNTSLSGDPFYNNIITF